MSNSLRFDEVVFLDDFFRSSDNGLASHPSNRRFLRAFFDTSCRRLGVAAREVFAASDGGNVDVGAVMRRLDLEQSTSGWASASIANLDAALTGAFSLKIGPRSLVVGWGLPPSLLRHVDAAGAAFLDIEVDPLRFGRHLYLCARTNDSQVRQVLESLEVAQELFWSAASTINGYFARNGTSDLVGPGHRVGLFAGQTEVDLALVSEGRLVTPLDRVEQISRLAKEVDVLLVKRHPYAGDTGALTDVIRLIPNAALVDHNIYGMFTARNLSFVSALSSGVLKEAEYFAVDRRMLVIPDRANPSILPSNCSRWFTVPADIGSLGALDRMCRSPSLWQRVMHKGRAERIFAPEALDGIFGVRWGLDANAPGLPDCLSLEPDRPYCFAQGTTSTNWLAAGWHSPEPWGVWSGSVCRLILPLGAAKFPVEGKLRIEFSGLLFASARFAGVDLDGELLMPTIQARENTIVAALEVDANRFAGRIQSIVHLHIDGAARPADATGQADVRQLGFGLVEIRISAFEHPSNPDANGGGIIPAPPR